MNNKYYYYYYYYSSSNNKKGFVSQDSPGRPFPTWGLLSFAGLQKATHMKCCGERIGP